MHRSTHTWPIKVCREAWAGRSLIDRVRQTDARHQVAATHAVAGSPNGDVDQNSISIVSWGITGGSRHVLTTPQYPDKTDSADRRRYSCDVIKTLRATEATYSTTSKAIAAAIIRGHTRVGRLHATRHS